MSTEERIMFMEDEAQAQAVPEVYEGPGFFTNFVNIFANPQKTFIALDQKPTWLVPFLLFLIIAAIGTYFMYPVIESTQVLPRIQQYEGTEQYEFILQAAFYQTFVVVVLFQVVVKSF